MTDSNEMESRGDPLEGTLLLLKGAHGKAVVELIKSVTSLPGIYTFKNILQHPNVQNLKGTPDELYMSQVEIFSYGTLRQYKSFGGLPALDEKQLLKLRQLSLISLSAHKAVITYQQLSEELDLVDLNQLEDVILDAISNNIIQAKLDQRASRIEIISTIGRDLAPGEKADLLAILENWQFKAQELLETIDAKLAQSESDRKIARQQEKEQQKRVEKATLQVEREAKANSNNARHQHQTNGRDRGDPSFDTLEGPRSKGKAPVLSRKRNR